MKKIALIDYGSGNIHSAFKALQKAGNDIAETQVFITSNASDLKEATHIVLPGVGAFADCYQGVASISGMLDELKENILQLKKPFLGICVGMQLLAEKGFENGEHQGFGFIKGEVKKFESMNQLKIPHMGWNNIKISKNSENFLFKNIAENSDFYFVHSYHFEVENKQEISSTCNYGYDFCSAIQKENIFGVQFHPEKSQQNGLKLLANFIAL
ncbi:MAG: imidazole glycerol phosphate synthase subunit HisH [Rickettsiales bacterium]|nr:imidazole glycerol phosphate synthase subunit HisH [Rickettsiales bacterium]